MYSYDQVQPFDPDTFDERLAVAREQQAQQGLADMSSDKQLQIANATLTQARYMAHLAQTQSNLLRDLCRTAHDDLLAEARVQYEQAAALDARDALAAGLAVQDAVDVQPHSAGRGERDSGARPA
jgi:hypothetical protein